MSTPMHAASALSLSGVPATAARRRSDSAAETETCCLLGAGYGPQPLPLLRMAAGLFVAAQTMLLGLAINVSPPEDASTRLALQGGMLAATLIVLAMLGWPLARETARQLAARRVTMEALFLLCVAATFALSCRSMLDGSGPVYFDVIAVLLMVYSVGRAVGAYSRQQALASLERWTSKFSMARRVSGPDAAGEDGVPVEEIATGDWVRVLPGEYVPVDGRIERGSAFVRETAFSGALLPLKRQIGDRVQAGAVCEDGFLVIRAETSGSARRVDALAIELARLRARPSPLLREADRFVRRFLPVVLLAACGTFLYWSQVGDLQAALFNTLAVLLVACPCAAGLAAPLALWRAMGELAQAGLLLKGGDAVEKLASADSVIFDKTGTLGHERFELKAMIFRGGARRQAETRALIVAVERCSSHPIAGLLRDLELPPDAPEVEVLSIATLPARGLEAEALVRERSSSPVRKTVRLLGDAESTGSGMWITVDVDGQPVGEIALGERLRDGASACIERLKRGGLNVRIMTGGTSPSAQAVAHLAPVEAGLTPEGKLAQIQALRAQDTGFRRPVFVGDGFNDAAALTAAHAGLALAHGSAVTVESADGALLGDRLDVLPQAFETARNAVALVRSNLRWAVAYNLAGIALAATGRLHPVWAALLMAASSALVAWRSLRSTAPVGSFPHPAPAPAIRTPLEQEEPSLRIRIFEGLHLVSILGQAVVLARLAQLDWPAALALSGMALAIGWAALSHWKRFPAWIDMTFAMLTVGGLGMVLGWWLDLALPGAAGCVCRTDASVSEILSSWMYGLMLLTGVPAMFIVRHTPAPMDWRRYCCTGMLLLGVPGMVLGMWAGGCVSMELSSEFTAAGVVFCHYVFMMLGMTLGMLLPHALELLQGLAWRSHSTEST